MLEAFTWHTMRAAQYQDAYWQWVKMAHPGLEVSLSEHPAIYRVFKEVYTYGWQYEMGIISPMEFRTYLRGVAERLGGDGDGTDNRHPDQSQTRSGYAKP